jgi:hypothetical protein
MLRLLGEAPAADEKPDSPAVVPGNLRLIALFGY